MVTHDDIQNARVEQIERDLTNEQKEGAALKTQRDADQATILRQEKEIEELRQELEARKAQEKTMEETIKSRYQKLMKERLQEEKKLWERHNSPKPKSDDNDGSSTSSATGSPLSRVSVSAVNVW